MDKGIFQLQKHYLKATHKLNFNNFNFPLLSELEHIVSNMIKIILALCGSLCLAI